jgi:photosystem II stability/assembly factor-like uncharacterized protein
MWIKKMKYFTILFLTLFFASELVSQSLFGIDIVYQDTNISIRGLSVVDNKVIWASGSKGTVIRSIDGGASFQSIKVNDCSTCDFRDIEAFGVDTAIILSSGDLAKVFKTVDGGKTWKMVMQDTTKNSFFDGMDFFSDGKTGFMYGDPTSKTKNGQSFFALYKTQDGGDTWKKMKVNQNLKEGEASFASSGTGLAVLGNDHFAIVSGGKASHIYTLDKNLRHVNKLSPPILQGKESTGINSIAISPNQKSIMVVGGDFSDKMNNTGNCFYSQEQFHLKSKTPFVFVAPKTKLSGYKSCVSYLNDNIVFATGTSGTDVSIDGGANWQKVNDVSYHVCKHSKKEKLFVFAGSRGKIGLLHLEE